MTFCFFRKQKLLERILAKKGASMAKDYYIAIILSDLKSVREILEDAGKPRVKLPPGMEIESAKEQGNGSSM